MNSPRFISGSLFGHITVMTFTSAVGLMGVFLVDLADMFFLSMLGEVELASAIGYAGSILFFSTSISIGLAITMSALVARAVGRAKTIWPNDKPRLSLSFRSVSRSRLQP